MIKLICPKCMKPVPLDEGFTGTEVKCPACANLFPAPARYNPAVISESPPVVPPTAPVPPDPVPVPTPSASSKPAVSAMLPEATAARPAPPPGLVIPTPQTAANPQLPSPAYSTEAPPPAGGYTGSVGITISPRVVAWLPAVLLTITFVSLFFRWTGSYLGGHPVHSQSPMQAVFGLVSRNFALEQSMPGSDAWLDKVSADWLMLVPYVLLLVLATGVAWAERGLPGLDPNRLPALQNVWPWRKAFVGIVAGLAFLLIAAQVSKGFGMDRAIRRMVRENPDLSKAREEAANSPAKLATVEYREEVELARYNLEQTWWQDLGLACNFIAVLAVFLSIHLDRRGNKPPPQLLLHY